MHLFLLQPTMVIQRMVKMICMIYQLIWSLIYMERMHILKNTSVDLINKPNMSIFKNDGYNLPRAPPQREPSVSSFKWRPTVEVNEEVQKDLEPAKIYLENLDKNQSDGEYDSHESEEKDYVKEDEDILKMKTYQDMDNDEEEEKIELNEEVVAPVGNAQAPPIEEHQNIGVIVVKEEDQSSEWSNKDDSLDKLEEEKKEEVKSEQSEEESQSAVLSKDPDQQSEDNDEDKAREAIVLDDSIDINDESVKEPIDYKENESITDSDFDMDAKYNMFATSAMPKDSVSRNLDFTYEDNIVKQINQNNGMVHRNRFEYDFQKKQGYLRDLSKEKKNNNFSKLLLTPDNRQRKLGYVHQSREDSIDRSSKRGVGIGF